MMPPPLHARQVAASGGQVFHLLDEVVWCKAIADDTGGAYALFELQTPPLAGMPPRRHDLEDVAFIGVAGTYTIRIGDETRELPAGAYAFAPRGMNLAYRNTGTRPARMLVLVSPGGIYERFLAEVGLPRADGSLPDFGKILAAAPKYGIEFLVPSR
jgi:quercetin dioxygenase-like cupin family protein